MKSRTRYAQYDFTGGLNQDDHPLGLQPSELRVANNVYWSGKALSSRRGTDNINTAAINGGTAVTGIFDYTRSAGASRDIVAVVGDKFYKDARSATPTDISGAVTITSGAANACQFATFNENLIVANGTNTPWRWTGTGNAAVLGGYPPAFKTIISKWNRVFGAGHTAAPRTIRFSALADETTWAAADTVRATLPASGSANAEGSDAIVTLGHLGDSIFCGLINSIGRVYYTGDSLAPFIYTQISSFGVAGPRAYVPFGDGGYFVSNRGVHYITTSDVSVSYQSSMVSGRKLRTYWAELGKTRVQNVSGTLYFTSNGNWIVVWSFTQGAGTQNNSILVMDVTDGPGNERFAIWTGIQANVLATILNPTTYAEELLFGTNDGFIWQADTGSDDNGAAYLAEATTRWEDFGQPGLRKRFRDLYLEFRQTGTFVINVDFQFDYENAQTFTSASTASNLWNWDDGTTWDSSTWGGLNVIQTRLLGVGDGHVLGFRYYTTGTGQLWSLYKSVVAVKVAGESVETLS